MECGAGLAADAESCPECGYPVAPHGHERAVHESIELSRSGLFEYRLVQLFGAIVFAAGLIAAFADSPVVATVTIAIGAATYLTGLLGSWWNTGD